MMQRINDHFPLPWSPLSSKEVARIDGLTPSEAIDRLDLPEHQRQLLRSFWALIFNG